MRGLEKSPYPAWAGKGSFTVLIVTVGSDREIVNATELATWHSPGKRYFVVGSLQQ